jgi:hypothetical protein
LLDAGDGWADFLLPREGGDLHMDRLQMLQEQKQFWLSVKRTMDKDAPMHTEEGMQYARVLTKLVLIELEIEQIEKEKAAR